MDKRRLVTAHYKQNSPKIPESFNGYKIAVLADLHNCTIGKEDCILLHALEREKPDLILLAGDMITEEKHGSRRVYRQNAEALLRVLAGMAPVYYGLGNHEMRWQLRETELGEKSPEEEDLSLYSEEGYMPFSLWKTEMESWGIRFLINDSVMIEEEDDSIRLTGLSLPAESFKKLGRRKAGKESIDSLLGPSDPDHFQILLAHLPKDFAAYRSWGADLSLAGHNHGGVIRLPLLGGVIGTDYHLFPKYDHGIYHEGGADMIVSSGLGMHTIPVRLNNPPELVMIELEHS